MATKARTENLEIPHTPWPLVQPLPNLVPKPTSKPAIINIGVFALISIGIGEISQWLSNPLINKPMINAHCQAADDRGCKR